MGEGGIRDAAQGPQRKTTRTLWRNAARVG
jgi:hypothetical protein